MKSLVRPGQGPRRRGLDEDRAEGVPVVHVIGQIEGQLTGPRRGGWRRRRRPVQGHEVAASIKRSLGQLLGICQIRSIQPNQRQQPRARFRRDAVSGTALDALPVEQRVGDGEGAVISQLIALVP